MIYIWLIFAPPLYCNAVFTKIPVSYLPLRQYLTIEWPPVEKIQEKKICLKFLFLLSGTVLFEMLELIWPHKTVLLVILMNSHRCFPLISYIYSLGSISSDFWRHLKILLPHNIPFFSWQLFQYLTHSTLFCRPKSHWSIYYIIQ